MQMLKYLEIIFTLYPFIRIFTGSRQQNNNNTSASYYNTLIKWYCTVLYL